MQKNTNCYWIQQPLQHNTIFTTHTILHPRLDVITTGYVQDIPRKFCNRIQAKKYIQRRPICMTDADCDCILDEIERSEKLILNGM